MKKLPITLLTAAALLFSAAPAAVFFETNTACAAESYSFFYEKDNGKAVVKGASGSGSSIIIPETIDGLKVTAIADSAFEGMTEVSSVTLPDSVVSVGKRAFSACTSLSSVSIGSGLESIGDYAFSACPALESFTVSKDNKVYRHLGGSLYKDNELIIYAGGAEAQLDSSTKVIGKRAFFGKTSLVSVKIPYGVELIGDYAFSGCLSLQNADMPDTVKNLGDSCFMSCDSLMSMRLSSSLKAIPEDCFYSCTMLKLKSIPEQVTFIGKNAFFGCSFTNGIYVPPSVETISENALGIRYDLRSGKNTVIPDFTICGEKGSSAERYASLHSMTFKEGRPYIIGDVNGDNIVDGKDATRVLSEYAAVSSKKTSLLTEEQRRNADFNLDSIVDGKDATAILAYYAKQSTK